MKIKQDKLFFVLNEDKTASLVDSDSPTGEIIIPRSIKYEDQEFIVTTIKTNSFRHLREISTIRFPPDSEVKTIEENSFDDCGVTHIFLPPSLTNLAESWIYQEYRQLKVEMIADNQYYKNYNNNFIIGKSDINNDEYDVLVFVNRSLNKVTIPPFIKQIAKNCFHMSQIKSIFIPEQVTQIRHSAFDSCLKLKNVEFHENSQLQKIENDLFAHCRIEKITIPRNVKQICSYAFANCVYLQTVEFTNDSKLETIEYGAFLNSPIKSLRIPSRTKLNEGWCDLNFGLKEINLIPCEKENLSVYGKNIIGKSDEESDVFDVLFFVPRDAKEVDIPPFIRRIGSFSIAYSYINKIVIPSKVTHIGKFAFCNCILLQTVEFTADSELHTIEEGAFSDSSVNRIIIPSSVTVIKKNWNSDTKELKEVIVIQNKKQNIMLYDNKFIVGKSDIQSDVFDILVFAYKDIKVANIPSFVKHIYPFAFYNSFVEKIIVPYQIEKISKYAFADCSRLKCFDIPENANITKIANGAFSNSSIERIHIPYRVKKICQNAFVECKSLRRFEIPSNSQIQEIQRDIFTGSMVKSLVIPPSVIKLDDFAFQRRDSLIIQYDEDSKLEKIEINRYCYGQKVIIMIPVKLTDRIIFI